MLFTGTIDLMSHKELIEYYSNEIRSQFNTGHAKEHAYRPALERLMSSFDNTIAVNDPKRSEHGNPDFIFLKKDNRNIIKGYAEAKDIDVNLDKTEKTNQMHRYAGYENLYLTNYIEFRFYQNGNKYKELSIGSIKNGELVLDPESFQQLADELQQFLELKPERIKSGQRLAVIMGAKARRIRDNVKLFLVGNENEANKELDKMYELMRELLVHDLSRERFADMYAQTLVYGLFVARYGDDSPEDFNRVEARDLVPANNPFLREFFDHIVGPRFDKRLGYIVDELCEVFSVSDVQELIHKHLKIQDDTSDKDPIIHFYEDFLKEYDPEERKRMGAYYTPVPVVCFMIREVDKLLKSEFDLPLGIMDASKKSVKVKTQGISSKVDMHRVQILDPAVGTATFLNEIIKYIHSQFKGQEGRWPAYSKQDLLPRIHGFELMMAPYTIAHLKLGMTLQDFGVKNPDQRLGVYLTNTLEEGEKKQLDLFNIGLAEVVTQESQKAAEIKHERPVFVVIGNPPYSGESSNKTEYAAKLVSKYKYEPGGKIKLNERNPKWINDDYVKFIAFAEDMVSKNGTGIAAMITNHSYLDNPTFRGMRWQLANTFDKIFILDLHGSTKRAEVAPDGTKDENVFSIQQGVSIIFGVKNGRKRKNALAEVYHSELYGTRKRKFSLLAEGVEWQKISLDQETYEFKPSFNIGKKEYDKGYSVSDIFLVNSVGIVTGADKLLISPSKSKLIDNLQKVKSGEIESKLHELLKDHEISEEFIKPVDYRPFDTRFIYYCPDLVGRSRVQIMKNYLAGPNTGIMLCRQQKTDGFHHALVHSNIVESSYVSNRTSEIGYSFPFYTFQNGGKNPNLNTSTVSKMLTKVSQYTDEDVFDYIYAILHSTRYRNAYKNYLKKAFPKIPAPQSSEEFHRLANLGHQLRRMHLLTHESLAIYDTTFPEAGSDTVDEVTYVQSDDADLGSIRINKDQYFGKVSPEAWRFTVGGYQPIQKWLKDRKGTPLSGEDIDHFQKMIKSAAQTTKIVSEIDL